MKVVHFITRLIIGGAQQNTLLTVEDQHRDYQDDVTLITGPGIGPEGSLVERAESGGIDIRIVPELKRNIHPLDDWKSYRTLLRMLREIKPQILHTHSSKAGVMGRAAARKLGILRCIPLMARALTRAKTSSSTRHTSCWRGGPPAVAKN